MWESASGKVGGKQFICLVPKKLISFAPLGLCHRLGYGPTACAVGCVLAPLRGCGSATQCNTSQIPRGWLYWNSYLSRCSRGHVWGLLDRLGADSSVCTERGLQDDRNWRGVRARRGKNENNSNTKCKGGGQECPPYTG